MFRHVFWPLLLWFSLSLFASGWAQRVQLFLSWNLKPYWEFAEGFEKTHLFETYVVVVEVEPSIVEGTVALVPVGHRALKFLLKKRTSLPMWGALILHPSLVNTENLLGGLYLRLPPRVFLPVLREELDKLPLFKKRHINLGIPYSDPHNLQFIEEVALWAPIWDFQIITLPLNDWQSFQKNLSQTEVVYFIPDPFLESEEVLSRLLKMVVLEGKLVVGYNRFFLEKGAFLAFLIDYKRAGKKAAQALKNCLEKKLCGWIHAPFKLKRNKKALQYFLNLHHRKEKETSKKGEPLVSSFSHTLR